MNTILQESVQGKELRAFRNLRWNSSNSKSDSATKTFWQVRTLMRKFNWIEMMKMKLFFQGLNLVEYSCLIDAPGVLTDEVFVSALIAERTIRDPKILLPRLNFLLQYMDRKTWSENLLYTKLGSTGYHIQELRQAIRKADKYSGYVRNSSSVGSKSTNKIFRPEPETFEWNKSVKIDFLEFLTVGEFSSGAPGGIIFSLTKDQKSETVIKLIEK